MSDGLLRIKVSFCLKENVFPGGLMLRKRGKYDILKGRMRKKKGRNQEGKIMATTTKKKTSQGRKNTTNKKSSSSKKGGSKRQPEKEGPDMLTVVVVLVAIVLVMILLWNYNKAKNETENPTATPTMAITPEPTTGGEQKNPETQTTEAPKATNAPTKTPEFTVTPEPTPEPTIAVEEARKIVSDNIDLEPGTYEMELLDDHLMIDGAEYFSFCINSRDGQAMEPMLLVEKMTGTLLCYDFEGVVSAFSRFPLDKTETGNQGVSEVSQEEAKKVLAGYSKEALGLSKEPSSYDMTVDEWPTTISGKDCYGINLFETVDGKQRFRGVFYVVTDGSAVYSMDDVTGDFIKR